MDELIKVLEKDVWDYVGIFAPIILSFVAIVISMWNSFWSKNVKKLESNMVWDDIYNSKSLLKCVDDYINVYVHTKISTRGFSPYNKIKETLNVRAFKVPKAKILTYR